MGGDVRNFDLGYLHGKRGLRNNVYYDHATMSVNYQVYADVGVRLADYRGFFMGIAPERKAKK